MYMLIYTMVQSQDDHQPLLIVIAYIKAKECWGQELLLHGQGTV